MKKNLKSNLVVAVVLILESKAGIEITALSTDHVWTDCGVDRSTFHLTSDVDRSHLIVLKMN